MEKKPLAWSKLGAHLTDPDKAREYMEFLRWGQSGPACPRCGGADPYRLTPKTTSNKPGRKGLLKCRACRKQFTVTVGTVFEDSHIPLHKWLQAIYLMGASKKGISAHQLHRMLGVTYRSAWFMAHRLRYAMGVQPMADKLRGIVEVDEAYIGGKRKDGRGRVPADGGRKVSVLALVERNGRARCYPVENVDTKTLHAAMIQHIDPLNTAAIMTDGASRYGGDKVGRIPRHSVNHQAGEFVRGQAHTNSVEGFFSLLKRGIVGTFHHVSKGHLGRYATEFEFRYNNRKVGDAGRPKLIVEGAEGRRLTYKQPASTSTH
jgi:transposase-like protein